jgi:hypothetical protein
MTRPRPPLLPPVSSTATATDFRRIRFRHPAYPESAPELLCLSVVDGDDGDGVDYDTAFLACCIVTGNKWRDGWLARKRSDGVFQRVERSADGILRDQVYYFCLSRDTTGTVASLLAFKFFLRRRL